MRRRSFIKSITITTGGILSFGACSAEVTKSGTVRFGISSDIHNDVMHDGEFRLRKYLSTAERENIDFLIDLGDFCNPDEKNKNFLKMWKTSTFQKYHVLGNHDLDYATKDEYVEYVGMENRYYSFDVKDFHFIVLDPNNLCVDGKYIPYGNANFYRDSKQRAHVDPEQLAWLKSDLNKTNKRCIVFSHQSFENPRACQNRDVVRDIFEEANKKAGFTKVVAAFSGHDHTDYVKEINGIHYIQINSMSYQWVGEKYKCPERFPDEINKKYPSLQKTVVYQDPLFAFVTLDDGKLTIDGVDSKFIEPGPEEVGITSGEIHGVPLEPRISDEQITL
ncbi:hypothetical protein EYV94_09810 [Puteibacter caeruleilacunae]|nr:hypothetical protein EYV94_09810 [Puteibacter caeruleilacunae]